MTTMTFERSLLSLAREIGAASGAGHAWAIAAHGLAALTGRSCDILLHDGTVWNLVARSGDEAVNPLADHVVRLPLDAGLEFQGELQFGPPAGGGTDAPDPLADPAVQGAVIDIVSNAVRLVALSAEVEAGRARDRRIEAFSRSLIGITDTPALHRLIVETMARTAMADIGSLAVPLAGENVLAITATHGYPAVVVEHVRISPGEGVLGRAYASGLPIVTRNASDTPGHVRRRRYRSDSYLALPLPGPDGIVGVVALTDKTDGGRFDHEDLVDLTPLALVASLALARESLRERSQDLAHLATIDGLTGLFNRRYFETRLEQEIQRQRRQSDELSLLMVDLDNFKELNDTQGHLVGDRVLREVADILRRAVRVFDVCARYGGEEFVILMPGASGQTALRIAERIRRQVEQHFTASRQSSGRAPTVSVGVSTATPTTTRETLIAHADSALFAAKSGGKNLVTVYPALTLP